MTTVLTPVAYVGVSGGDSGRGRTGVARAMALILALLVGLLTIAPAPAHAAAVPVVKLASFSVSSTNGGSTTSAIAFWDKNKPQAIEWPANTALSVTVEYTLISTDPANTDWTKLWVRLLLEGIVQESRVSFTSDHAMHVKTNVYIAAGSKTFVATLNSDNYAIVDYDANHRTLELDVVGAVPAPTAGTVTITGTPQTGSTVSASLSGWANATSYDYQWLRNGSPIPGAMGSTYSPVGDDIGAELTVKVTGNNDSGYAEATSGPVTVTGTATTYTGDTRAAVGGDVLLAADVSSGSDPVDAGTVEFVRVDGVTETSLGSAPVVDGRAQTTITFPADWSSTTRVVAKYSGASGLPASQAAPAAIEAITAVTPGTPVIVRDGTPVSTLTAGETYGVDAGTWSPSDTALTYEWVVLDGDTERIAGTASTFTPATEDLGKQVLVRVTGAFGPLSSSADSTDLRVVAPTQTVLSMPGDRWRVSPGATVTVTATVTSPAGSVGTGTVTLYDESDNVIGTGTVVGGVATMAVTFPGSVGSVPLRAVYVDDSETFGSSANQRSVEVATISAGSPRILLDGTPATIARAGELHTVDPGTWGPSGVEYEAVWFVVDGGSAVEVGRGLSYTPTASDGGKELRVTVTGSIPGLTAVSADSVDVPVRIPTVTAITLPDDVFIAPAGSTRPVTVAVSCFAGAVTAGTVTLIDADTLAVLGTASVGADGTAVFDVNFPDTVGGTLRLAARFTDATGPYLESDAAEEIALVGPMPRGLLAPLGANAGTAKVGEPLGVDPTLWPAGTTFTYTWLRDGVTVVATTAQYVPTDADVGHRITLIVTAHLPGYDDVDVEALSVLVLAAASLARTGGSPLSGAELLAAWLLVGGAITLVVTRRHRRNA